MLIAISVPILALCFWAPTSAQKNFTCSEGYYVNGDDAAGCFRCNPGHRCNGIYEAECPHGTVQILGGQKDCQQCGPGTYQNMTGQLRCQWCPAGHFCPTPSDSPTQCPPGTSNFEKRRVTPCEHCEPGHFQPTEGQKECLPCPRGHSCETPDLHPRKCPIGTHQSSESQSNCTICPEGHFQSKSGQTKCHICPSGYECSDPTTLPVACPAGKAQHLQEQTFCKHCPRGTYTSLVGQEICVICPSAHFCPSPDKDPIPCPPGTFELSEGQTKCQPCPMGYFQDKMGKTSCTRCPNGFYCPWPESVPMSCPPGSIQPNSAQTTCDTCPEGQYQTRWRGTTCSICPAGHSCSKSYFCPAPCPVGQAQFAEGSTHCFECITDNGSGESDLNSETDLCPLPGNTVCGMDCKTLSVSCDRRLEFHLRDTFEIKEGDSEDPKGCQIYHSLLDDKSCRSDDDLLVPQLTAHCDNLAAIKNFQDEISVNFSRNIQKCIRQYFTQPLQTGCQGITIGLHAYAICFQELQFCNLQFGDKFQIFEAIGDNWWTGFSHGAPEYFSCFRGILKYHVAAGPKFPIVLGGNYSTI